MSANSSLLDAVGREVSPTEVDMTLAAEETAASRITVVRGVGGEIHPPTTAVPGVGAAIQPLEMGGARRIQATALTMRAQGAEATIRGEVCPHCLSFVVRLVFSSV